MRIDRKEIEDQVAVLRGAMQTVKAALGEADLLDPARLSRAVDEASRFYEFLTELFEGISQREELQDIPFDRKAAALALKLYLGET